MFNVVFLCTNLLLSELKLNLFPPENTILYNESIMRKDISRNRIHILLIYLFNLFNLFSRLILYNKNFNFSLDKILKYQNVRISITLVDIN